MRVAILTTETLHHTYFVREVAVRFPEVLVLSESSNVRAPFPTEHHFEKIRDDYERSVWFGDGRSRLADYADTRVFGSANEPDAIAALKDFSADAAIVFGTGRLKPATISVQPDNFLNLHGGDPQAYRGLDSHLWAIYHRDFAFLVTTLHSINAELDDGNIVGQGAIPLNLGMELHELRRRNSEVCVQLVLDALSDIKNSGVVTARPQTRVGRYYSHMPSCLKDICYKRFRSHCSRLDQAVAK